MSVSPEGASGENTRVSGGFLKIRSSLVHAVYGLEVFRLVTGSISNNDLTGVLVWHHNARLG